MILSLISAGSNKLFFHNWSIISSRPLYQLQHSCLSCCKFRCCKFWSHPLPLIPILKYLLSLDCEADAELVPRNMQLGDGRSNTDQILLHHKFKDRNWHLGWDQKHLYFVVFPLPYVPITLWGRRYQWLLQTLLTTFDLSTKWEKMWRGTRVRLT